MKSNWKKICWLPALALASGSAMAGFTPVGAPHVGEDSLNTIFNTIYAQTFVPSGADYIGNGGVTLTRVDDFGLGGVLNLGAGVPGLTDDQQWSDGVVAASAQARFASDSQSFGYFPGSAGGAYSNLFDVTGSGYGVSGNAVALIGPSFRWARSGGIFGNVQTSSIADNPDQQDHVITFRVTGLNNGAFNTWLLCWEDRNTGQPDADFDYNDLVVEINAVPTPMAAGLGLVGLGGVVGVRRRRSA